MREWFCIVEQVSHTPVLGDLRVAWSRALNTLKDLPHTKRVITGLMTNVICITLMAGWYPATYNMWRDPDGNSWVLDSNISSDNVSNAIIRSLLRLDLLKAQCHHNGAGLQDGLDWNASLYLLRSSSDFHFKCTLESIQSACMWPAARVNQFNKEFPANCSRCDCEIEDDLHCLWTCPANAVLDDPAVQDTQNLIHTATAKCTFERCLWLRGLLPFKYTLVPPDHQPSPEINVTFLNENESNWTSGTYYGDSSGGSYTSYPSIRRCGCAVVQLNPDGTFVCGARFNLPGSIQTVARGELFCLVWLVEMLQSGSDITFVTDNKGVFDTFNGGPKAGSKSMNADLYGKLFNMTIDKAIKVTVRWMPSHLQCLVDGDAPDDGSEWDIVDIPDDVSEFDILANAAADKHAGIVANCVALPLNITSTVIYYTHLVKRVQKRLVAIIMSLPQRIKKKNRSPSLEL